MTKENKAAAAAFSLKDGLEPVSELTTNRLSVYLRCLNTLDADGVKTISSQALAEQFHLNAAQIRKDLANFGEFGVRGVGYYVKSCARTFADLASPAASGRHHGGGEPRPGAGGLPRFREEGFEIAALFANQRDKIGQLARRRADSDVRSSAAPCGASASPSRHRRPARRPRGLKEVVEAVIKAVLNFSPGTLKVPPDVK